MGREESAMEHCPISNCAELGRRHRTCDAWTIGQTCKAFTKYAAFVQRLICFALVVVSRAMREADDAPLTSIRNGCRSLGGKYTAQQCLKRQRTLTAVE